MEKLRRKWGAGFTWGVSNVLMSLCFVSMIAITAIRSNMDLDGHLPPQGTIVAALVVFSFLGIPLDVTYTVPYALVSTHIEALGLGQGLSMGVLNMAIVIPQVIVSLGARLWDQLFGGLTAKIRAQLQQEMDQKLDKKMREMMKMLAETNSELNLDTIKHSEKSADFENDELSSD